MGGLGYCLLCLVLSGLIVVFCRFGLCLVLHDDRFFILRNQKAYTISPELDPEGALSSLPTGASRNER